MTDPTPKNSDEMGVVVANTIHAHWRSLLVQGVVMMVLGLLAIALPQIATIAVEITIAWLLLVGGVIRTVMLLRARQTPGVAWSLLTSVLAAGLGLVLLIHPLQGAITLTIALIVVFVVEGLAAVFVAFEFRRHVGNWGWVLFSGAVNLAMAFFIWQGLPATADWAVGLLVGINMFMMGFSIAMMAFAARNLSPGK